MKQRWLIAIMILAIAWTGVQASGPVIRGWRVGPLSMFAQDDNALELAPNNGWCVCKQLADYHQGRIHVVYTKEVGGVTRVYSRYTDNYGRSWSPNPQRVSRNDALNDDAYDGVISCLGDSVAVAFYDDWYDEESQSQQKHMAYNQSLNGGEDWLQQQQIFSLSDDSRTQYDNRHPSIVVTYTTYDDSTYEYKREGPIAQAVWIDSIDAPGQQPVGAWPYYTVVEMQDLTSGIWEKCTSDSISEYPSIAWNRVYDTQTNCFLAEQERWNGSAEITVKYKKFTPGTPDPARVTNNNYPDERPSIQCTYGDASKDTVVVVYQSKPAGSNYRIRLARGERNSAANWTLSYNNDLFPGWGTIADLKYPNIWYHNDTLFLTFLLTRVDSVHGMPFFSYSTNTGRSWLSPPIRVSTVHHENASIFGHGDSAYVAAVYRRSWPVEYRGYMCPLSHIPDYALDDVTAPNTARVLQRLSSQGGYLHHAFGTGDFVAVDRSTDDGETWEDIGSPGYGGSPSIAVDGDSIICAAYLRDDTLFCSWWRPDEPWADPITVFAGSQTAVPGQPSVTLYPDKVSGVKVAAIVFPVYNSGSSRVCVGDFRGSGIAFCLSEDRQGCREYLQPQVLFVS